VAGLCEHDNETLGLIKGGVFFFFFDWMSISFSIRTLQWT
jgi:hypothetical protein